MRRVVKRARWLLLRTGENIPAGQQTSLDEMLAANLAMKAGLKELWQAESAWQWRSAWRTWLKMAHDSEIEPLRSFANKLKAYWRGSVARVRWPMHTGQLPR